jgi:hypothetical protein
MSSGKFPRPYVNDVPREGSDKVMEYVPFDDMDIGARKSGMVKDASKGPGSLDHVGGTAGGRK